eukprot:Skav203277  [mRNA]  locus=scaffold324:123452:131286:+ [translate_table: standard]
MTLGQHYQQFITMPQLLELREPPEECCPLYVCIEDCGPPTGKARQEGHEHLLTLKKGDVVRVVSRIEPQQKWLQGYVDSMEQSKPRGWFPRKYVEKLQDNDSGAGPLSNLLSGSADDAMLCRLRPKAWRGQRHHRCGHGGVKHHSWVPMDFRSVFYTA